MTRAQIETALDSGKLFIAMYQPGRWWALRRNGRTQTWKRSPERFRIPVKFGLKGYDAIEETYPMHLLRIADDRQAAEAGSHPRL